jgi:hypothetical protein
MTSGSIAVPPAATRRSASTNWALEDPVLEQVAGAAGPVGEQLAGVELLDVLRELAAPGMAAHLSTTTPRRTWPAT